jgi:hypothetical protein
MQKPNKMSLVRNIVMCWLKNAILNHRNYHEEEHNPNKAPDNKITPREQREASLLRRQPNYSFMASSVADPGC